MTRNVSFLDDYTVMHLALGAAYGAMGASAKQALAIAVGWELAERPLKRLAPGIFPTESQDSPQNALGDVLATLAGWYAVNR
jgi:hypothetical protein